MSKPADSRPRVDVTHGTLSNADPARVLSRANMARKKAEAGNTSIDDDASVVAEDDGGGEDVVLEGTLVCALTGEHKSATPQEETLQSFIEQLHREYGVPLSDMARDVRVEGMTGEEGGKQKKKTRTVQLVVYEHGKPREVDNIARAVLVAKPGTKADAKVRVSLERDRLFRSIVTTRFSSS